MSATKSRKPPRYKQLLVFVPEEEKQLGLAWEVLWHLKNAEFHDRAGRNMAISTFLALTEELLEEYCPPYEGGKEWDTIKGVRKQNDRSQPCSRKRSAARRDTHPQGSP